MTAIIEIQDLCHFFTDGTCGLDHINLRIEQGSFVVIGGCNGSGKTTLLRHFNGLLLPTSGQVIIDGIPVERDLQAIRQKVGMVFQDSDNQIVGETVHDDVAFGPENLGLERQEIGRRVEEALQIVSLSKQRDLHPHLLSGGQKRRLTIASVLAMQPQVLVFDEPFSNLDYPSTKQVLQHIVSLQDKGHTIVLTTHELEKVIAHCQRLIIMHQGRVARDATPASLFNELEQFGIREPCCSRHGIPQESWLS
ncbi:energy-coupling factor ABC transporter ATP-binding protein [Desulfogranum japonicum]|uniref:energy-coupling factor ABC transporter ATP-binding protein n=1 Tax=Desulfogranum japonicum TaxID=231447 RepID=UPI00040D9065|nr:ATP-binding cassette domain-containing protein [Desulfogranum japonicum]